jgi:cysteine desulfurase
MPVYLDHTATTPLASGVWDAMLPYFTSNWLSPGGLYRSARALKRELDGARQRIAAALGAGPNEIIVTSSGTESINLALRGVAAASQHRGRHLITTPIEHRAVLDTVKQLEKQGWRVSYLSVDSHRSCSRTTRLDRSSRWRRSFGWLRRIRRRYRSTRMPPPRLECYRST